MTSPSRRAGQPGTPLHKTTRRHQSHLRRFARPIRLPIWRPTGEPGASIGHVDADAAKGFVSGSGPTHRASSKLLPERVSKRAFPGLAARTRIMARRLSLGGMQGRFPEIEPYDSGMLDVTDGHQLYWECCGNPDGKPAIYLHGGPGSGCTPGQRRFFDPSACSTSEGPGAVGRWPMSKTWI